MFGDGLQSRGNTYVSDCVAATVLAIDRPDAGTILNIGGGREIALLEAIEVLADELGVEPRIEFEPPRPGDQRRTLADTSRARVLLGWRPEGDPELGLRRQAAWVRSQGSR